MAKRKPACGIGLVGLGFMGLTHLRAAKNLRGGRVVAVVTSDPRKARGDFSAVKGNFGDAGEREDMSDIEVYPTLDAMLADDRIDLVDVCLPSHLHAKTAIRCLRAGRPTLVEKPIALRPSDARRMIDASAKAGQPLLVAQVLKFFPEFRALESYYRKGTLGDLLALHHRRIIAKPNWSDDDWLGDPKRSGGMTVDLHIHDTDFIVHLFGRPRSVSSRGLIQDSRLDALRTTYDFGRTGPLVTAEAGWINGQTLAFEHGYDAFFEKATIRFNSTTCPAPRLFGPRSVTDVKLPKGDGFEGELQAAVDSIRTGEIDPRLSAVSATTSLTVCLAEERSARTRAVVRIPSR